MDLDLRNPKEKEGKEEKNVSQRHADEMFDSQGQPQHPDLKKLEQSAPEQQASSSGNQEAGKLEASTGVSAPEHNTFSYKKGGDETSRNGKGSLLRRLRGKITKKVAAGAVAGTLGLGLLTGGFFAVLPFKSVSILESVHQRIFGASENAIKKSGDNLFEHYIKKHVLKKLGPNKCGSSIDRNCMSADIKGNSMASRLYRGWKEEKLESKLAEDYGIEFKYTEGKGISATVNNVSTTLSDEADSDGNNELKEFFSGRQEVRARVNLALAKETKWKQVWQRHKLGKLLERKYHLKRCIVACDSRDEFKDKKDLKKKVRKIKLVERVVEPKSQTVAVILNCLIDIDPCKGEGDRGPHGERRSAVEKKIDSKLSEYSAKYGNQKLDELLQKSRDISDSGLTDYILKKVLGKTLGTAAKKFIPVLGWIDLAATIVDTAPEIGGLLKSARYASYAASSASLYMMYRTNADEIKAGQVDAELAGSFARSFDSGDGDQGYGTSPAYNQLLGTSAKQAKHGSGVVYAQDGTQPEGYRCGTEADGDILPSDKIFCSEESFSAGPNIQLLDDISANGLRVYNNPFNVTRYQIELFKNIVRPVLNAADGILEGFVNTFLDKAGLKDSLDSVVEGIQKWVLEELIGNPFSPDMSGARTMQGIISGGIAANTENANNGMGGKKMTREQLAEAVESRDTQRRYAFEQKSFFERFFDIEQQRSITSTIAMQSPTSLQGLSKRVFQYAVNPTTPFKQAGVLASATMSPAHAATSRGGALYDVTTALGVVPIGVPNNDPALSVDPDKLTVEYCEQRNKEWFDSAKKDDDTGYYYQDEVNECLLVEQTIGAFGGLRNDEVLAEDERNLSGPGGGSTTSPVLGSVQCPATTEPHPTQTGYFKMPEAPNGEYEVTSSDARRYGSKQLVCVLYSVGLAYNQAYLGKSKLSIDDLNGGDPHKSHYKGIAVDVDAVGEVVAADHLTSGYDTEATIALGKLFVDTGQIKNIWWCDPGDGSLDAIIAYANSKGTPLQGAKCIGGHKNHFHIDIKDEFAIPGRFEP